MKRWESEGRWKAWAEQGKSGELETRTKPVMLKGTGRKRESRVLLTFLPLLLLTIALSGCKGGGQSAESGASGQETTGSEAAVESSGTGAETEKETEGTGGTGDAEAGASFHFPKLTEAEYPVVDGSTATLPLSTAMYQLVTGASEEEANAKIRHYKTNQSYINLAEGAVDLVLAYEPSRDSYDITDENGALLVRPIGRDALVFLANEGNPVKSLSSEEIINIYRGRIRNWKQLGGENRELVAFQRPEGSGSQTMMNKLVMKSLPMTTAPTEKIATEMGDLIDVIASYSNTENALGYSVYFYAKNMYQSPGLRFMAVNQVMPSNQSIQSGEYPYINEFYAAIRKDEPENSSARRLFDWLTTQDGQRFLGSLGYVPVMAEIPVQDREPAGESTGKEMQALSFRAGEYLLLDGKQYYGESCIVLLDQKLQEYRRLYGLGAVKDMAMIRLGEPVLLRDGKSGLLGIYDLQTEKWAVEPEYEFEKAGEDAQEIVLQKNDYLADTNIRVSYRNGTVKKQTGNMRDIEFPEYTWSIRNTEPTVYMIRSKDGKRQKMLDFPLQDYRGIIIRTQTATMRL